MNRDDAIVSLARSWIGTPYVHRASVKGAGCDCLGLIRGIWQELGGAAPDLPAYGKQAAYPDLADGLGRFLRPVDVGQSTAGHVLVFSWRTGAPPGHCGIRSGPDHFIHCYGGRAVAETALTPWWQRRLTAAFAFPEEISSWDN